MYGPVETGAPVSQVLMDQRALAWCAHKLWKPNATSAGLASRVATALLQHLWRADPDGPGPPWRTCVLLWTDSFSS